jgi:hypothetical protein
MVEPAEWRSPETERELNRLERQGFAWEFLRRNPDYRRDFDNSSGASARPFGASTRNRSAAPQWGLRFPAGPSAVC